MTKEQAIKIIKTAIAEVEWEYPMDYAAAFDMAIEALKVSEGTDTISRQAALDDAHRQIWYRMNQQSMRDRIDDWLKSLPSAEPERKKGKWTKENSCEFCGFQPWFERDIHTLSYCPNCGADMRGDEE